MSQTDNLRFYSAIELTEAYGKYSLSSVEACQAVLELIDTENPVFNAMCFADHDRAILAAHESEARWLAGKPLSRIDGMPATVNDLTMTRDWPTRRGSLTTTNADDWAVP